MKIMSTILGMLCFSTVLFAQQSGQRTPGNGEVFETETIAIYDRESSVGVSEAVAVIHAIRNGINTSTKETSPKKDLTEADYQTLAAKADEFMIQRNYDSAILLYQEILKERTDQYAKDRMLEAEALRAKQQREEEQRKKDDELFAKAESALSEEYYKSAVHFTGALMSDISSDRQWTTEAFNRNDPYSDFLQPGKYNDLADKLKRSTGFTLDGIAIPANTRLIVYGKPNCTGEILLDITGPAIVNNGYRYSNRRFKELNSKEFYAALQAYFPQSARTWSDTNMHTWLNGSLEIVALN